jgi:hypothetical protein
MALIAIVVIKAVLSLAVRPGSFLVSLHYNCRALRTRFILRLATPALAVISERQGKAEALV